MPFPMWQQALARNDTMKAQGSRSLATAGTTGKLAMPDSVRQIGDTEFHGNSAAISTQRNVNALQAQAEHGLSPAGADGLTRGQAPASLADQTKLHGAGASSVDGRDYLVWNRGLGPIL